MADESVNHLFELINQHIDSQESLNSYLSQAEALIEMSLSHDFYDCSDEIKYHYFMALSDILCKAKDSNLQAASFLFQERSLLSGGG